MNTPIDKPIDDETLMAYADGELDALQAAQIEQAMQADAGIAARVAQHRALRAQLQGSFTEVLSEPVPQRLLNSLQAPAAGKVIDLAQARQNKTTPAVRRWSSREWSAMAASLVAGIVMGWYALNFTAGEMIGERAGALIAQGKLDSALTTQLASSTEAAPAIHIGISFRNRDGEYCRSFAVTEVRALAGLACHEQDQWRVQMLTDSAAGSASEFRQAGSTTPAAVLALIDQQIEGEPLDAQAEAAAQRKGWQ